MMFRRKKKEQEKIPWYRKREYKGNLTEEEKRELDSFRWIAAQPGGKHPAAEYGDLPEEVQSYISKIQVELYDAIQERLAGRVFLVSGLGAFYLANYFGWITFKWNLPELALVGACLMILPWFYYGWKWRKNAAQFSEQRGSEGIRTEWELDHVVSKKRKRIEDD
jgi:hypothetical protein